MSPVSMLIDALCASKLPSKATRTTPCPQQAPTLASSSLAPIQVDRSANVRSTMPPSLFPKSLHSALDESLQSAAIDVMTQGLAKGTISNYTSAINAYTEFCDLNNIRHDLRFPADEAVLCAFVSSMYKKLAGTTVETIITALKRWHDTHRMEWHGSERLQLTLRGVKNNAPASSRRPKRMAIDPKMLDHLRAALDPQCHKDMAIWACANAAFWGQARLGELLGTSRLKHNSSTHPSRNSVVILLNNNAREIQLPKTKTSQDRGESIFLTRQNEPWDPVMAIENHFQINHGLADADHLFAYRSEKSHSGRHSLTREDFLYRVNQIWSPLGYQRITGHSFRIGGTTTLLKNGVPPDVVKELGRWSSDAFHEYWRDIPAIAAKHVQFLPINGSETTTLGAQARSFRPLSIHRVGQNPRQGRPAFAPY